MADSTFDASDTIASGNDLSALLGGLQANTNNLASSANSFANAMTRAFTQATTGGKQFDTVLQSLALRISGLAVTQAFKPIASGLTTGISGGLNQLFGGLSGSGGSVSLSASMGAIKPFASGGVIGTP